MPYTRLKAKCLDCSLHFIVYTWDRHRHSRNTLHCPERGQHESRFLTWRDEDAGEIRDEVSGLTAGTPAFKVKEVRNVPLDQLAEGFDPNLAA